VFVIESGILGLMGGVLGVLLGYGIAKMGQAAARAAGLTFLKPYFPLWLTFGSLAFAFLVGAASGTLPAIRASKQRPVESLRYE
jgi:putative ABC transport system permease protein